MKSVLSKSGFTVVELMVVVAMVAILASVAIPAYSNYVNRSKQSEAIDALMRSKMDQEVFWADNNRYAATIGCLNSFGNNCSVASYSTPNAYRISVVNATTAVFTINAARTVNRTQDRLHISGTIQRPSVDTPNALKWSVFDWIFK